MTHAAPVTAPSEIGLTGLDWLHTKSGNVYRVERVALREADLVPVVVYRGADGITWTRPATEFLDGRFQPLPQYPREITTKPRDAGKTFQDLKNILMDSRTWKDLRLEPGTQVSMGYDLSPLQDRVHLWATACFGDAAAQDSTERNHRFLEEALELVQANGCAQSEAHQLVDYVFARPVGEPHQEVGGTILTLAALCTAIGIDMDEAGETELARVWKKFGEIRAKQAAKPKHSPLPGPSKGGAL